MRLKPAFIFTLLIAVLFTFGCAGKSFTPHRGPVYSIPLTDEAAVTYNYLVYMDQIIRIQKLRQKGVHAQSEEITTLRAQADDAISEVIRLKPNPQHFIERAFLYWVPSQVNEARLILNRGLNRYPENRALLLWIARSYVQERRFNDAVDAFGDYIRKYPDDIGARAQFAESLLALGKTAESLDQISQIPAGKRTPKMTLTMAQAEFAIGKRQLAVERLRALTKKYPTHVDSLIELAYYLEQMKDYAGAEETYSTILDYGMESPSVRLRLISLNLKLNNIDKAYDIAVENAQTEGFIVDAANLFVTEGFVDLADSIVDLLFLRNPVPQSYYYYKAIIAYSQNDDGEIALQWLDSIQPDFGKIKGVRILQMEILLQTERFEELAEIIKAEHARDEYLELYTFEARLHAYHKDFDKALKTMDKGLELYPDNPELLFERAYMYDALGKTDDALREMEYLITIDPDNSAALNFVGYTLAEQNKDLDRALVFVTNALRLSPSSPYYQDSLAWVYFRQGKFDKAMHEIQKVLKVLQDSSVVWDHYGDIARALGQNAKAITGYNNALKYAPIEPQKIEEKLLQVQQEQ
ncbi:MAG: tetratricopeptide repeat protein [Desulfovibrio sp.]